MAVLCDLKRPGAGTMCRVSLSCNVMRCGYFALHRHTELELSLILSGTGVYSTSFGTYSISEGDIFLFGANREHCITDADGLALVNVHFTPRFFSDSRDTAFLAVYDTEYPDFTCRISSDEATAVCMRKILMEARCQSRCSESMICVYLTEALINILRGRQDIPSIDTSSISRSRRDLSPAIDHIDTHYREPISLDELAQLTGLSRTYFSTLFSQYTGMSLSDYINIKRIEHAKLLLRTTSSGVLDIALRCGFNNTAHFNRCFRSLCGTSPVAYRKDVQ